MSIDFMQESLSEALIQSLRRVGIIGTDDSANVLRGKKVDGFDRIHNGLSDAEITAIVNTLSLSGTGGGGGGGGGGSPSPGTSSTDDVYILVDSDADPVEAHQNYLRVLRWRDSTSIESPEQLMFSVYWKKDSYTHFEHVLGPDTSTMGAASGDYEHTGRIMFGGLKNSTSNNNYGMLAAGPTASLEATPGVLLQGRLPLSISGWCDLFAAPENPFIKFFWADKQIRSGEDAIPLIGGGGAYDAGGFYLNGGTALPALYIGSPTNRTLLRTVVYGSGATRGFNFHLDRVLSGGGVGQEFNFTYEDSESTRNYFCINHDEDASAQTNPDLHFKALFQSHHLTVDNDASAAIVCHVGDYAQVGGDARKVLLLRCKDASTTDGKYHFISGMKSPTWDDEMFFIDNNGNFETEGYVRAAGTISGNKVTSTRNATNNNDQVHFWHTWDSFGGNIVKITSNNPSTINDTYNFVYIDKFDGAFPGQWDPMFRINNRGSVYNATGSYTSPADVAELVEAIDNYDYGVVLVINSDGRCESSSTVADPKVFGVVSEEPGLVLGCPVKGVPEDKTMMAVCGFTPVDCTTANGSIFPGDRLVSAPGGKAQKASDPPTPGTILGKAMEALEQPGDDVIEGQIRAFVNLQ